MRTSPKSHTYRHSKSAIRTLLTLLTTAMFASGCTSDTPQTEPTADTAVATPGIPSTAATTFDSAAASDSTTPLHAADPAVGETAVSASTTPSWSRRELVEGLGRFIRAIDSNDRTAFFGSLAARSLAMIESDRTITRDRVWDGARNSLGSIQGRRISVIGGSRDSVALEVQGKRLVDGQRVDEPVIVTLLRESGTWKVIYPGLQYPTGHLQR